MNVSPPPGNPLSDVEAYLPDAEHGLAASAAVTFYVLAVLWFLFTVCTLRTRHSTTRAQCYAYMLVALAVAAQHTLRVLGDSGWPDVVLTPAALCVHAAVCTALWLDVQQSLSFAVLALTVTPALCAGVLLALDAHPLVERVVAALHALVLVALSYGTLFALGLARRGLCRADLLADCGLRYRAAGRLETRERGGGMSLWLIFTVSHLSPVVYVVLAVVRFHSALQALVARLCCDGALLLLVPAVVVCYSATFGCTSVEPYYLHDKAAVSTNINCSGGGGCASAARISDDDL